MRTYFEKEQRRLRNMLIIGIAYTVVLNCCLLGIVLLGV